MRWFWCFGLVLMPIVGFSAGKEALLVYRGDNNWVAPEDNKPLRQLMAAAKNGVREFKVILPSKGRGKSVERLEVLRGILVKSANAPVVLEEIEGRVGRGILVRY